MNNDLESKALKIIQTHLDWYTENNSLGNDRLAEFYHSAFREDCRFFYLLFGKHIMQKKGTAYIKEVI